MKYRMYLLVMAVCLVVCCPVFAADSDNAYIIGEVKDGVYTNRAMGAEAHFGDDWYIMSREEIAMVMGITTSLSPTLEELTNGNTPVFYAIMRNGQANLNITIANIGSAGKLLTDPDSVFMNIFMENVSQNLAKVYTEMGAENFKLTRIKTSFLGSEYPGFYMTSTINKSVTQYQKQVFCIKGEYEFIVTSSSTVNDITDDALAMFRKISD